jgi:hypothetical protein
MVVLDDSLVTVAVQFAAIGLLPGRPEPGALGFIL